ncbi:hypothetical protein [Aphanothece sacrum]|uniref:Phycoerythrin beta subunit n=1 Tax=Aphanothece sacrum FPU1 TaxID=1920663 RepID=A0A401IDT9_APHSA|nr:hypothetical protein [Aphanothece sacrum]GBF79406.1 phycoerythrin beta subunit [Aphanothece sacrum FPU1]GBF86622.1 hypothetical protein AsFPU3_3694 [Aphanothece sacrum FPU3]
MKILVNADIETYLLLAVPIDSVIDCVTIMKGKIVDLINNHTNEF